MELVCLHHQHSDIQDVSHALILEKMKNLEQIMLTVKILKFTRYQQELQDYIAQQEQGEPSATLGDVVKQNSEEGRGQLLKEQPESFSETEESSVTRNAAAPEGSPEKLESDSENAQGSSSEIEKPEGGTD